MVGLVIAALGGCGVFMLVTAAFGWTGFGISSRGDSSVETVRRLGVSASLTQWLTQAGITGVGIAELGAAVTAVGLLGGLAGAVMFGSFSAALSIGLASTVAPLSYYRSRRRRLLEQAAEAWPQMLEEVRMQTSSLGRPVPIALLDVGRRAPTQPMREAFEEAHRQWLLSTDFPSTVSVIKNRLASATADSVCETLLIAHEVGGADLDRRLGALIEDRIIDLASRRDAQARQAGVKFARWFTIAVPIGMALVGASMGDGRKSYATPGGQIGVLVAAVFTAVCWMWASAIMRLPEQDRVLNK
jgi:tight adherence protein B